MMTQSAELHPIGLASSLQEALTLTSQSKTRAVCVCTLYHDPPTGTMTLLVRVHAIVHVEIYEQVIYYVLTSSCSKQDLLIKWNVPYKKKKIDVECITWMEMNLRLAF